MSKTIIHMNERIRQKHPDGPVIVVRRGKTVLEGNRVDILHHGEIVASVIYDPAKDPSPTHRVTAWVETRHPVAVK